MRYRQLLAVVMPLCAGSLALVAEPPASSVSIARRAIPAIAIWRSSLRVEVEPITRHYRTGEIGPPDAMFLARDVDWREFGLIEWRVK